MDHSLSSPHTHSTSSTPSPLHESTPTHSPREDYEQLTTPTHDNVSPCNSDLAGPKTPVDTMPASPVGPLTPPTLQEITSDPSSPILQHVNISDISSDMESSTGQSADVSKPVSPLPVTESTPESLEVTGDVSRPHSPSAKTPMRRKVCVCVCSVCVIWFVLLQINLSEYRNRARKPVERKSSSEVTPSTPSHSTPPSHYPTPPPPPPPVAVVTGMSAGITMETGMNLPPMSLSMTSPVIAMTTLGSSMPQFEPVSPDESDPPPLTGGVGRATIMSREIPLTTHQPTYVTN